MKIDTLYIPTYGREGRQITFDNLPDKWKEKTFLVTSPDENHEGYPELKCVIQGTGIAPVRQWISEYAEGTRYGVLDDDLLFMYTRREHEEGLGNVKLSDDQFDNMINTMDSWMDDGYIHTACDVCWNPPTRDKDFRVNTRITTNIFYDGTQLPVKDIDWVDLDIAEDYNVNLQLLMMGFQNKVSLVYRINPSATQATGGCQTFRTLELHNDMMQKLQKKFPIYVKLNEKVVKSSGEWSGKSRLAATISWKRAYESSQVSTITDFMS